MGSALLAKHYTSSRQVQGLLDLEEIGARVKAIRVHRRMRASDAAVLVKATTGIEISSDTWYRIERAETMPSLEILIAIVMTFRPQAGIHHFVRESLLPDVRVMAWDTLHAGWVPKKEGVKERDA
jgi:DNA-binding XRE family transcriptional regulator